MTDNLYHDEALIKSVTYSGRNGHRVSLECDPDAWERLKGSEGTRVAMVLVPIAEDGNPDADKLHKAPESTRHKPVKESLRWEDLSAVKQAAIRCQDEKFQRWVINDTNIRPTEYHAIDAVRRYCKVGSRADITDENPEALRIWFQIDARYRAYAGLR